MDIRPSDLLPALGGKHLSTPRYGWIPSGSGGRLFVWDVPPHTDSSGLQFCFDLDPKTPSYVHNTVDPSLFQRAYVFRMPLSFPSVSRPP